MARKLRTTEHDMRQRRSIRTGAGLSDDGWVEEHAPDYPDYVDVERYADTERNHRWREDDDRYGNDYAINERYRSAEDWSPVGDRQRWRSHDDDYGDIR